MSVDSFRPDHPSPLPEGPRITLERGRAVVWFTDVMTAPPSEWLEHCESFLDPAELIRQRAFHFQEGRSLYAAAHALLRTSLSRYADVPPRDWRFTSGEFGRPEIAPDQCGRDRLRFNLSHTAGLAACAITNTVAVGLDVERLDRSVEFQEISSRYFSRREAAELAALPPEQQRARFFEYWTLKEAYFKARGRGLSIPLDSVSFERDGKGRWGIAGGSDVGGDSADWQFESLRPTVDHVLAVAIHRPGQRDHVVEVRATRPSGNYDGGFW